MIWIIGYQGAIWFERRPRPRKALRNAMERNRPLKGNVTKERPGTAVWIATFGGTGYFPVAPGTAGAAVGVLIVWAIAHVPVSRLEVSAIILGVALVLTAVGIWASGRAEKYFGRLDPGPVVIDEVVGQMITLLLRPDAPWKWLIAGFLLFRVFDTTKPFPARRAEHAPGGWGIMLDDVVAGCYGLAGFALLWFLVQPGF